MELTPFGVQQVNNTSLPETHNKRRINAVNNITQDPNPTPSTSVPEERASKRRRETSIEAPDSTAIAKQYLTKVRIPVAAPPAHTQLTRVPTPPRTASGESSGLSDPPTDSGSEPLWPPEPTSPDTLSNNTLTPSTVSRNSAYSAHTAPGTKPTTRSITDKVPSRQQPLRHEILKAHRNPTLDPLSLLAKANAPEPYKPQSYKEAIADEYIKIH